MKIGNGPGVCVSDKQQIKRGVRVPTHAREAPVSDATLEKFGGENNKVRRHRARRRAVAAASDGISFAASGGHYLGTPSVEAAKVRCAITTEPA